MKIGDKLKLTCRFDSGWWVWADGKEPEGPHHLPSGIVAIVKELKDVDGSPVVIFSIIGPEDGKESSPVFSTAQDVFENFFDELPEVAER
jgi:hypothetical protein